MLADRLSLAVAGGDVSLPAGPLAVLAPRGGTDLSDLPQDRLHVVTQFKPDHDAYTAQGYHCLRQPEGPYAAVIVCLPRSKDQARALVAQAGQIVSQDGLILVDGQKTDGVESMLRELRGLGLLPAVLSKAHGKLLWFTASPFPEAWQPRGPQTIADGFVTAAGVFSADGVDPASRLLGDSLPDKLGPRVVDLGAGWGYLATRILERDSVRTLDLVEADHTALDCAAINVSDARARLHWADATRWTPETSVDAVVMNPPFHTGRSADPDLGRAFIAAAAAMLTGQGRLWMVANRHLPYEATLGQYFTDVSAMGGDTRFKILMAARPSRQRR